MRSHWKIALLVGFVITYSVSVLRTIKVSALQEGRARSGLLGDGFSDRNTLSSAQYFLDSGFNQTAWLPVHDYFPGDTTVTSVVYTHYPALPNILAGIYATLLGSANEMWLRIFPLILSLLFYFLIFHILSNWLKDPVRATLGALSLTMANYFICWSDNLHQHLYGELLKWLYTWILFRYYEQERKPWTHWLWLLLIMIAEVNISFEQPVFLGILTLGFSWIYQRKIFSFETFTAGMAVGVGFALHLWQNAVYFGSWNEALADMTRAYTFRASGAETVGYVKETEFTWRNFPEIPFLWFNRMERFYVLPGWFVLIIYLWFYNRFRADFPKLFNVHLALFFASIAWTLLMAQHGYVHGFTNKHFSIWYAIAIGVCLPYYFEQLKTDFQQKKSVMMGLHVVMVSYAVIMFLTQQFWEVWLRYGWLYPNFGT